jgi:molecular chaperone GrpE
VEKELKQQGSDPNPASAEGEGSDPNPASAEGEGSDPNPASAEGPSKSSGSDPSSSVSDPSTPGSDPIEPLAKAERERDEYLELSQRTRAELENYRKRAAREAAQAGERAKANLVRELLPVLDNLERAIASAGEDEQHLADGVRMVHAQLVAALEREGIQSFDPAGEEFDPECHEALSTREDGESGRVLDVVEKGYRLNGTVLRPARVVVSA